eukprot:TRINITY_DN42994_c0_g3_i2.p1 TRINITY_DN42994_c0_g3~~TRINITY_DN42994_c0_g3_i2.p1  ORF type:complete len:226 (+),score=29.87 TRINITY_DN42994_c0_g3_i2:46-723(+)
MRSSKLKGSQNPQNLFTLQQRSVGRCRQQRGLMYTISCMDQNELAKKVQEKEAQLSNMFVSGGKIPQASEVAVLRQELKELREQLAGEISLLNESIPPNPDVAIAGTISQVASEKARRVLLEFENRMQQNSEMKKPELTVSERTELEALELENITLRARANKLLLRQQLLEELMIEYKQSNGAQIDESSISHPQENEELEHALKGELGLEREQDKTAVMQAPSYY